MAESLSTQLTRVQARIAELEAPGTLEEYQVGSRRARRDVANQLRVLYMRESRLKVAIARSNRSPIRVGSLGRASRIDRSR